MLDHVTYHACIRYLQRVLCLPVDDWCADQTFQNDKDRAAYCCERAGLPVDAIKLSMLTEAVMRAMRSPSASRTRVVTTEGVFIVCDGRVITVLGPEMRHYRKKKYKAHKSRQLVEV